MVPTCALRSAPSKHSYLDGADQPNEIGLFHLELLPSLNLSLGGLWALAVGKPHFIFYNNHFISCHALSNLLGLGIQCNFVEQANRSRAWLALPTSTVLIFLCNAQLIMVCLAE